MAQTPDIDTLNSDIMALRTSVKSYPAAAASINVESVSSPPPPLFQETSERLLPEQPLVKQLLGRAPVRNRRTDSLASSSPNVSSPSMALSEITSPPSMTLSERTAATRQRINQLMSSSNFPSMSLSATANRELQSQQQPSSFFAQKSMTSSEKAPIRRIDALNSLSRLQGEPVREEYVPVPSKPMTKTQARRERAELAARMMEEDVRPLQSQEVSPQQSVPKGDVSNLQPGDIQMMDKYVLEMARDPLHFPDIFDYNTAPEVAVIIERIERTKAAASGEGKPSDKDISGFINYIKRIIPDYYQYIIEKDGQLPIPRQLPISRQLPILSSAIEATPLSIEQSSAAEPQKETKFLSASQQRYEIKQAAAALEKKPEEVDSDEQRRKTDLVEKYIGALESLPGVKQALDDADADVAATWKETNGRITRELDEKQQLARQLQSQYLVLKADADAAPAVTAQFPLSSVHRERIRAAKAAVVPIASSSQRSKKDAERPPVTVLSSSERYERKEAARKSAAATTTDRENAELRATADDPNQELSSLLASSARISTLPSHPTSSVEQPPATSGTSNFFSRLLGRFGKGGKNTHHHRKKSKSALSRKNSKRYSVKAKRRNRRKSRR